MFQITNTPNTQITNSFYEDVKKTYPEITDIKDLSSEKYIVCIIRALRCHSAENKDYTELLTKYENHHYSALYTDNTKTKIELDDEVYHYNLYTRLYYYYPQKDQEEIKLIFNSITSGKQDNYNDLLTYMRDLKVKTYDDLRFIEELEHKNNTNSLGDISNDEKDFTQKQITSLLAERKTMGTKELANLYKVSEHKIREFHRYNIGKYLDIFIEPILKKKFFDLYYKYLKMGIVVEPKKFEIDLMFELNLDNNIYENEDLVANWSWKNFCYDPFVKVYVDDYFLLYDKPKKYMRYLIDKILPALIELKIPLFKLENLGVSEIDTFISILESVAEVDKILDFSVFIR
jgi:hypothetical protein